MIWYIFIFNYTIREEEEILNKVFGVRGLPGLNGALAMSDPLSPPSIFLLLAPAQVQPGMTPLCALKLLEKPPV